jgi:nicotinate-nucleotide adenylyltransferase
LNFRSDSVRWNEVTAVFGGRFDPPHLGHREAVRGLFRNPGVKGVLIIPSAAPPHKLAIGTAEQRLEMAKLNFQSTPRDPFPAEIRIDARELIRAQKNPHVPSYTYDTLQELRQEYSQLAFVIGADQLAELTKWYRFPEVLTLSHWIVLERQPSGSALARATLQEWEGQGLAQSVGSSLWKIKNSPYLLTVTPTEAPNVSSTAIRENMIRSGFPPENSIFEGVLAYLKAHPVYGK